MSTLYAITEGSTRGSEKVSFACDSLGLSTLAGQDVGAVFADVEPLTISEAFGIIGESKEFGLLVGQGDGNVKVFSNTGTGDI